MGIGAKRPPISIKNTLSYAYLSETERFSIDPDMNIPIIEKLIDGIWQPTSIENFSYDKIDIGREVKIPINQQMAVYGELIVEGNLKAEGNLIIEL